MVSSQPKKELSELSWFEVKKVLEHEDTIIIPTGATEQVGPHLPLSVDSIVAYEIAKRVAENTNTLLAPLISIGYSDWHMQFAGTITLRFDTLIQVLRDIYESLIKHGFKKFMFINAHGGNNAVIEFLAYETRKKYSVLTSAVDLWKLSREIARFIPELKEKKVLHGGLHGGEIMTSVMLFLRPELVNMDKTKAEYVQNNAEPNSFIRRGSFNTVQFKDYHVSFFRLAHEVTESGTTSDPIKASKEKGQKIVNKWVSYLSEFLEEFKKGAHHEIKRKSP